MKRRERDRAITEARVSGASPHKIARQQRCSIARVSEAIDRFDDNVIDGKIRKNSSALELTRLNELQQVFYQRALEGDVQSGALVTKIIERRRIMLGLSVPQAHELKVIDATPNKPTSTDKIEAVLRDLKAAPQQRTTDENDDSDSPPAAH